MFNYGYRHSFFLENNHLHQGESKAQAPACAHLLGRSQAILPFPKLLAGSIQALLAQPVTLQLLPHLLFRCGLTLLELSNACQELLVTIDLTLWRRKNLVRECDTQESGRPTSHKGREPGRDKRPGCQGSWSGSMVAPTLRGNWHGPHYTLVTPSAHHHPPCKKR